MVNFARTRYSGTNHTQLSELLDEFDGIYIGGLKSPQRRRPPKHRIRRQRMPREGLSAPGPGVRGPEAGFFNRSEVTQCNADPIDEW